MPRSIKISGTLFFFCLSYTHIKSTTILSTSYSTPLAEILTPNTHHCRFHLIFNHLSTLDLPTTHNLPLTLTKQALTLNFNPSSYIPNNTSAKLDILQNKGWVCEFVTLFVTQKSPNFTKSHATALGYWVHTQANNYFSLPDRGQITFKTFPDNLHFLLILRSPNNGKGILLSANSPLYNQPLRDAYLLPVKFSILLFSNENKVQLCHKKSLDSVPTLQNFACGTILTRDTLSNLKLPLNENTTGSIRPFTAM